MPQLDRISLGTTIFWFILSYFSLYFIIVRYILPNILKSLKYKAKKLKRFSEVRHGNQRKIIEQIVSLKVEELKLNIIFFEKFLTFKTNFVKVTETNILVEEVILKELY